MPTKQETVKESISERAYRGLQRRVVDNGVEIAVKYTPEIKEKLGLKTYGQAWTVEQDALIVKLFDEGANCAQVASVLGRSVNAVQSRASQKYHEAKTDKERAKWRNKRTGGLTKIAPKKERAIEDQKTAIRDTVVSAKEFALKAYKAEHKKSAKKQTVKK